jgi:hypothetical protein
MKARKTAAIDKPRGGIFRPIFCSSTAGCRRFSATLQSGGSPPFQSKKSEPLLRITPIALTKNKQESITNARFSAIA